MRDGSVASFVDRESAFLGIEEIAHGNFVSVVGHGDRHSRPAGRLQPCVHLCPRML
jgi:hypothetical protein